VARRPPSSLTTVEPDAATRSTGTDPLGTRPDAADSDAADRGAPEPGAAAPTTPEPDLDAIAADLAGIEATLDQLAAGTYRHEPDPPAS